MSRDAAGAFAKDAGEPPVVARFDRLASALSERTNPLFVKELRQALRGKWFKVTFVVSLALTTLAGLVVMAVAVPLMRENVPGYEGLALFVVCLACTAIGTAGLVPFSAFSSMNAEADENALELLQLSNLSPIEIVTGKLASAFVQAVLVTSTVLPFAALAWMLGGLSPWVVVLGPAFAVVASVSLSAVGIALSTLSRTRWVRVLLMVLFGFFLFSIVQNAFGVLLFGGLALFGLASVTGGMGVSFGGFVIAAFAVAVVELAVAIAFAGDMLSHREESGSTPMRRIATAIAALGAIVTGAVAIGAGPTGGVVTLGVTLFLLAAPLAWCCTESEALPLGARARPPRRLVGALHVAGGGRGALLATALLAFLGATWTASCAVAGGGKELTGGLVLVAFEWIWLLFPSVAFSPFSSRRAVRVIARIAVWLFPWLTMIAAAIVNAVLVGPTGEVFDNPANPIAYFDHVEKDGTPKDALPWLVLLFVAFVTFAANAWRMGRGVVDVRRAMRERDARETRPSPAEPLVARSTP